MAKRNLTVIMPALDEEQYLACAFASLQSVLDQEIPGQYEVLIFNDGSKDKTGMIADELARKNSFIKVMHHQSPQGLASITRTAINIASKDYITWYPGDHSVEADSLRPLIRSIGKADVLIAYMTNNHLRTDLRRFLSIAYVFILNSLFGLKIRYYNGASIFPVCLLKTISIQAEGHGFFAEIVIKVLKKDISYLQLPFVHRPESQSPSKAISLKNLYHIAKIILALWVEYYVLNFFLKRKRRL